MERQSSPDSFMNSRHTFNGVYSLRQVRYLFDLVTDRGIELFDIWLNTIKNVIEPSR